MTEFQKQQRERVLKSIEREKELSAKNLCRRCAEKEATTQDQLCAPICQDCRDYLEYGIKR